jgi:hypothetical protein
MKAHERVCVKERMRGRERQRQVERGKDIYITYIYRERWRERWREMEKIKVILSRFVRL